MAVQRGPWWRGPLAVVSAVVPVGVGVAGNQVLNDGVWNGWWALVAVTLAVTGAGVGYRLGDSPSGGDTPVAGTPVTPHQTVARSSAGADIVQAHVTAGGVRIGGAFPPVVVPAVPPSAAPGRRDAEEAAGEDAPVGGQSVTGSAAGGSIIQIGGAGGDVTVERS